MIYFYSTRNKAKKVSLEEAVMKGLADDGGLFMPQTIPILPHSFFNQIASLSFHEIAFKVAKNLLQDSLPDKVLEHIITNAFNFEAPLKKLVEDIYVLELFHGPTLSFKDFGACFMAQLMGHYVKQGNQTLHILVATSGDTGSAIGQAFLNVPGIRVWILYPKEGVSWNQEKQLTTIGNNITALEIEGTFDDCQKLVKQAFSDNRLQSKLTLTSANSINIARLIPQTFYYFYAYAKLKTEKSVIFSVPCGNFGNLTAGILAKKMGLPVKKFIAATNVNDTIPKYLQTGIFEPRASIPTLSNAMDVGNPSNFERMLDLYEGQVEKMRSDIIGRSFTDAETTSLMQKVFDAYGYLLDPHGAVAYLGLQSILNESRDSRSPGIFLETAHPVKFADDVLKITNQQAAMPIHLEEILAKEKQTIVLSSKYEDLCSLLINLD